MSGCSDPTCPSNKPEHFHIENWRLLGVPTYQYIVGDLNPGHITTGRVLEINEQEGWARTALYRVTLGEPAAPERAHTNDGPRAIRATGSHRA